MLLLGQEKDKGWKFTSGFRTWRSLTVTRDLSVEWQGKGLLLVGPRANGRIGESRCRPLFGEKYSYKREQKNVEIA